MLTFRAAVLTDSLFGGSTEISFAYLPSCWPPLQHVTWLPFSVDDNLYEAVGSYKSSLRWISPVISDGRGMLKSMELSFLV